MRPFRQVDHLDDINQAVQMLGDLLDDLIGPLGHDGHARQGRVFGGRNRQGFDVVASGGKQAHYPRQRSEEHTSELQSLMRISYAVFCLKKKKKKISTKHY